MNIIRRFVNRGSDRSVKYKKNTLYMFFLKGVSMAISFIYVPLLLNTLDSERYGIWLTLTTIVTWVAMLDIGLGNGLRNKLAVAIAENNFLLAKKYVSSAYVALSIYIFAFLLLFIIVSEFFIPWNIVLNATNVLESELRLLVNLVFISFGFSFILNLLNSILFALQSPALSTFISTLGQLCSLISVLICVKFFDIDSLLILGVVVSFVPVLIQLISTIYLFANSLKNIRPQLKFYDRTLVKSIIGLGLNFFIIQIMTIFLYQSNNLIITHIVGNDAVVEYNVANKYIQIIQVLYIIIVTPLWSATTQAYVKGEFDWIRNMNKNLNKIVLMFFILGLVLFALSPYIYNLWLGNGNIKIALSSTFILLISEIFRMLYGNYGYIINGIGKLHAQLVISIIMAVFYVPISVFFGYYWGLPGILMTMLFVNFVNFLWSRYQFKVLMDNKQSSFWNK